MNCNDETTTVIDPENDEDKMLILSGPERLEYFQGNALSLLDSSKSRRGLFQYLKKLVH